MSDRPQAAADMAEAERRVRDALFVGTPTERCDTLMNVYWSTPEAKRDAFVAVLVARLTLVPYLTPEPTGAAA